MSHTNTRRSYVCNPHLFCSLRRVWIGLLSGLMLLVSSSAHTQSWPDKPLRVIVPFSAGGAVDVVARIIAERMATSMGQSIIIDNRLGAGGVIGTEIGRAHV